jgi:hypothetical protein
MRPAHRHACAAFYISVAALVSDDRLLADRIDGKGDCVAHATGIDLDPAGLAVENERHRHQRIQCVALGTAVGRDIGFAGTDADAEIENILDHLRRQAGAVVADSDPVFIDADGDRGCDPCLLAGVERVVDQLLEDDERPVVWLVTGLRDQFLAAAEIEQTARLKGGSLQMVSALCRLSRGRGGRQVHRHHLTRPRLGRLTWRASVRPR